MDLKNYLREDLYKAIVAHYEKEDYTETLRDALFHIKDILQEKSGNYDKDNTGLVESCLLGKNPSIRLNKGESDSEKDFQQGIGFAFKGLCMHIRNPISHEKITYTQEEADSILLYINYLLKQIDNSSGKNLIEDWIIFLKQSNFTATKEYAEELIKELPAKKRYDRLVNIYKERTTIEPHTINNFINQIVSKLTIAEKKAFVEFLNDDLKTCEPDYELSMFFHFFAEFFYDDLKKLVKLHIEDLILQGIKKAEYDRETKKTNSKITSFLTWTAKYIEKFSNQKELYQAIYDNKTSSNEKKIAFIDAYYHNCVNLNDDKVRSILKEFIERDLEFGYEPTYKFIAPYIDENKTSKVYVDFKEALDKYNNCEFKLPF